MLTAKQALDRVIASPVADVLDVGSGPGHHAEAMRAAGKSVTTVDIAPPADVVADYMAHPFNKGFGCIWAAHVLEHQENVGDFLQKCYWELIDGGLLAITVPPLKQNLVGGHLTLWNEGLLLYNLILAGFDCSEARVGVYDYNISVLVHKKHASLPKLNHDKGDIEKLAQFFPVPVAQNIDGRLGCINW